MEVHRSQDATEQCRRLEDRLRVLSEATRAFAEATTDPQGVIDTVARRVAEVVKDYCVVLLLSDDGKTLVPAGVFDPDPYALQQIRDVFAEPFLLEAHPLARSVIESGEPFVAARVDVEKLRPPQTAPRTFDFVQRMGIHSTLIVALRVHHRSIGQLTLARFRPDSPPFDEHDLDLAQTLADHAALAISNARLLAEARRQQRAHTRMADHLRTVAEASHEFSASTDDHSHLLEVVARRLGELVGDMCVIRALTEDGLWIESTGGAYHKNPELLAATREVMSSGRQRVGEGISGRVAASGQPVVTPTISPSDFAASSEPRYRPFLERLAVTSSMTLPLRCRGKVVGVANLMRSNPEHPYDDDDLRLVQSVAEHAALAIENARAYAAERVARDTAEKATNALRGAQSRINRLRDAGILGVVVTHLDGRVVEINDTLLHMLGYSRDEILSGRVSWKSLTPPEWNAVDAQAVAQLTTRGVGDLREKEYLHRDGTRVPVLAGSAMLEGSAGECISFVLDLSERKAALAAVLRAALVEASDDAIIGKTLDGVITSWNRGAQRLFGYSADEMLGQSISRIIPPGHEHEESTILSALAKGDVKHFDTVRRTKDGRDVDVSVTSSPVHDASGHVVGISKVARDITERVRAEAALARAKDDAEAANRELEAFSYSVAHDLRAPLRGMNGFAQVLLDSYRDKFDAEGQDWLEEILLNAKKMGALIDGLLSLAQWTRSPLNPERIDLSAIARDIAANLRILEPHRTVEVNVKDGLRANLDPRLARVLLQNLLGNAWKFTSKGPAARIDFDVTEKDGAPAFFVRDNGAGFDMAYASQLFAPFQRLHTASEFSGTGIGLATVQRIVHRHGGRIWAEGVVDGGATFYFTFPARASGVLP